jgi:hypothetical protein
MGFVANSGSPIGGFCQRWTESSGTTSRPDLLDAIRAIQIEMSGVSSTSPPPVEFETDDARFRLAEEGPFPLFKPEGT